MVGGGGGRGGGGEGGRGGGGGVKIEKCSECHGKPKKCIKNFSDYTPFDQVGGGEGGQGEGGVIW